MEEAGRRYAEESLRFFIDGGKYARDGKSKNIRWLTGVINSSGATANGLRDMLDKARHHLDTMEETNRFNEAECRIKEIIESRSV